MSMFISGSSTSTGSFGQLETVGDLIVASPTNGFKVDASVSGHTELLLNNRTIFVNDDIIAIGENVAPNDLAHQKGGGAGGRGSVYIGNEAGENVDNSDGGAANNTFIGNIAGQDVTSGAENTFVGAGAGSSVTTGNNNVIIGRSNNGETNIDSNVIIGHGTGTKIGANGTSADYNIVIGSQVANLKGGDLDYNILMGYRTSRYLGGTTSPSAGGKYNVHIGYEVAGNVVTGSYNVAIGYQALENAGGGSSGGYHVTKNIAIGFNVLKEISGTSTAEHNVVLGTDAAGANTSGKNNIVMGYRVAYNNSGDLGQHNILMGTSVGNAINGGDYNVILGRQAGVRLTTANDNILLGQNAGYDKTTGNHIIAIGKNSGRGSGLTLETNASSIFIGSEARSTTEGATNETVIGTNAIGKGSNTVVLGDDNVTDIYMSEDVGAKLHTGDVSGSSSSTGSFGRGVIADTLRINKVNTSATPLMIGAPSANMAVFYISNHLGNEMFRVDASSDGDAALTMRDSGQNADVLIHTATHTYFNNNGNFGIGTTSPGAKLTVHGDISGSATSTGSFGKAIVGVADFGGGIADSVPIGLQVSTGENSKIRLNRNNNLSNYLDIVGGTGGGIYNINTSATNAHIFKLSNSEIARFSDEGLRIQGDIIAENFIVSSSTTYMTTSFSAGSTAFGDDVNDTHKFTGSMFIKGQGGGVGESLVLGSYGDGATQIMIRSNGASNPNIRIERGSSGNNFSIQNNGALNILRNSTALMTFKYTGEVGINETSPDEKLHVGGNIFATGNISGSSTSTGSFGRVTNGTLFIDSRTIGNVGYEGKGFEVHSATSVFTVWGNTNQRWEWTNYVSSRNGENYPFYINNRTDGRQPFVVHKSATNDLLVLQNSKISGSSTSTGSFGAVQVQGSPLIHGNSTGIGIGSGATALSPDRPFIVSNGQSSAASFIGNAGQVSISLIPQEGGTATSIVGINTLLSFRPNGTQRTLDLKSTGRVGMGTTTPQSKLDILDDSNQTALIVSSSTANGYTMAVRSSGDYSGIVFRSSGGHNRGRIWYDGHITLDNADDTARSVRLRTGQGTAASGKDVATIKITPSGSNSGYFNSHGGVSLGRNHGRADSSTSTDFILHVSESADHGLLKLEGSKISGSSTSTGSFGNLRVGDGTAENRFMSFAGDEGFKIGYARSGFLADDGSSSDGVDAEIVMTGTGGSAPFNQHGSIVYKTRAYDAITRSSHIFYTGRTSAERVRIDHDGNVGIGTASPGVALEVIGSVSGSSSSTGSFGRVEASAIDATTTITTPDIFVNAGTGLNNGLFLKRTGSSNGLLFVQNSFGDSSVNSIMSLDNSNTGNGTGQRIDFTFSSSPHISITGRKITSSYGALADLVFKHHRSHVQSDSRGFARFSMNDVTNALGGATGYTGTGAAAAAPSFFVSTGSIYVETGNVSGSSTSTGSFGSLVVSDAIQGDTTLKGGDLFFDSFSGPRTNSEYLDITSTRGFRFNDHGDGVKFQVDGTHSIIYLGTTSFDMTSRAYGNVEPGTDNTYNLGSATKRWANIHSADLHLSNEDTEGNEVDGTTGNWTIQEGEDDLFLLNRKNGKKYRFKLEEIT